MIAFDPGHVDVRVGGAVYAAKVVAEGFLFRTDVHGRAVSLRGIG